MFLFIWWCFLLSRCVGQNAFVVAVSSRYQSDIASVLLSHVAIEVVDWAYLVNWKLVRLCLCEDYSAMVGWIDVVCLEVFLDQVFGLFSIEIFLSIEVLVHVGIISKILNTSRNFVSIKIRSVLLILDTHLMIPFLSFTYILIHKGIQPWYYNFRSYYY